MIRLVRLFSLLILFLALCGCSGPDASSRKQELHQWHEENGKIKVLSTIAMIDDLVKQIGGEFVDCMVLIKNDLDPHSYQMVKGDDEKLVRADLIFYNGLGLEHGPSLQHHLKASSKAIGVGDKIQEQHSELIMKYNGQLDPHIWMDVSLWAKMIPAIVEELSRKNPLHTDTFQQNGKKLEAEMIAYHEKVRERMQIIPAEKRYLVTSHDAFNYFTRAYLASDSEIEMPEWQMRFAAPEGLAPESQLSPIDIQNIIDHVQKYKIHILFPESNVSKDSIRKILQAGKEKGLELSIANKSLYADAMGPTGSDGDSYMKMIEHNVNILEEYLFPNPKSGK